MRPADLPPSPSFVRRGRSHPVDLLPFQQAKVSFTLAPPPYEGGGRGEVLLALLFAFTFLTFTPSYAQTGPKTVVLLVSGLTLDDLNSAGSLATVQGFVKTGSVGLLNTAVSGEATEEAAFLSLGAGERMAAPERSSPRLLEENGGEITLAGIARQVYAVRADEDGVVRRRYQQRFGIEAPPAENMVLHLGLPALMRAQPSLSRAGQIGALGEALQQAGKQVRVFGDWRAALFATDRHGIARAVTTSRGTDALRETDILVASMADHETLNRWVTELQPIAQRGEANVLIINAAPPRNASGKWDRLGFVVASGPAFASGTILTSPTTRTRGLMANIDIAPTLLALHNAGHLSGGTGQPLQCIASHAPLADLATLDRQATGTARATVPVGLGYGIFAIGSALLALFALLRNSVSLARIARFLLLVSAAVLLALLPVGVLAPWQPWQYGLALFLVSLTIAVAAQSIGAILRCSPLALLLVATSVVVIADAFFGSPLVSRALLSGFYLAGIRFYGIGNEYMGLLVGATLIGPALLGGGLLIYLLYTGALLALALPALGADAGGALGATVAFVTAYFARRVPRLQARHIAFAFAAAFILVILMALWDRMQPAATRSHVGAAVATGQANGIGALAEIAFRKVAMNIRLTLTPYMGAALAGLLPIWYFLARGKTGEQAKKALAQRPSLARMLPAAGWGAFASLVFNDSGTVAAVLLLAPVTAAVLDSMLQDIPTTVKPD